MNMRASLLVAPLAALLLLPGCNSVRTWDPAKPPERVGDFAGKRFVLFAPVAVKPIVDVHPDARRDFALELAMRTQLLSDGLRCFYGETLPPSDDARWDAGPVGSAAGAQVVVLTTVEQVVPPEHIGTPSQPGLVRAYVTMRAVDASGRELWRRDRLEGRAPAVQDAKMMAPASHPWAKASWNAVADAGAGLRLFLKAQPDDLRLRPSTRADELPLAELVPVNIDSSPRNGEIFVDGVFRGTTPSASVPLPRRELKIRIERPGYQTWERSLTPAPGMAIQPILLPLAPTVPVTPPPAQSNGDTPLAPATLPAAPAAAAGAATAAAVTPASIAPASLPSDLPAVDTSVDAPADAAPAAAPAAPAPAPAPAPAAPIPEAAPPAKANEDLGAVPRGERRSQELPTEAGAPAAPAEGAAALPPIQE